VPASKYPAPQGQQNVRPHTAHPPLPAPDPSPSVIAHEKVLAEITHELGNFFHKLYYWSDYLKEEPARKSADSTAAQMLERTIKNLEDFLKLALDYFHPIQLSFIRMDVAELVDGLLTQLRAHLNGTPITVADTCTRQGAEVMVDPGHLSQALEVAMRYLARQVGPDTTLRVAIANDTRQEHLGLEVGFQLHNPNEASPLFRTAEAGVEWAVAQKVVARHGGALSAHAQGVAEKTAVLFLPLRSMMV